MGPVLRKISVGLVTGLHAALVYWLVQPHYSLPRGAEPAWKMPPIWVSSVGGVRKTAPNNNSPTELQPTHQASEKALSSEQAIQEDKLPAPVEPTYFDPDQLDKKADPVGEWVVDASAWPHELKSVQIELWVNDEGQIDRWHFLNVPQPSPELLQFLRPLPRTLMNPAWRQGKPVHSRLRIEIFLDG